MRQVVLERGQGLKPIFYFEFDAARLKSCPDAKTSRKRVFAQPVEPLVIRK